MYGIAPTAPVGTNQPSLLRSDCGYSRVCVIGVAEKHSAAFVRVVTLAHEANAVPVAEVVPLGAVCKLLAHTEERLEVRGDLLVVALVVGVEVAVECASEACE